MSDTNGLKYYWVRWLKIAKVIGNIEAKIILTVFYFFILWPVGLVSKYCFDTLQLKSPERPSQFNPWEHQVDSIEDAQKQS